jgi:glycosyltransferase involved in cell wall biosynthesis
MGAPEERPLVSIIIPTYMEEKYLPETLRSIRAQEVDFPYEIIVADANSTDRTQAIAAESGATVVLCPKSTVAEGRVYGIKEARGDIFILATGDNSYSPGWLRSMISPFADQGVAVVIGKIMLAGGSRTENFFSDRILFPAAKLFTKFGMYYAHGEAFAIRRSVYEKIGGIDPTKVTGDDTELAMKAAALGQVYYQSEAVVYTSRRRVDEWGPVYFLCFHIINFFRTNILKRPLDTYDVIR